MAEPVTAVDEACARLGDGKTQDNETESTYLIEALMQRLHSSPAKTLPLVHISHATSPPKQRPYAACASSGSDFAVDHGADRVQFA